MRCFITGAAGFIGSHLAEELVAAGHDVTGLDDLSTGRLDNLSPVAGHPRFRLVEGSILDAATVSDLASEADWVFHLAAAVGALPRLIADEAACGRAVNLGSAEQVSTEDLARRVITLTGSASGITRASYLEAYGVGYEDMERRVPDCTLATGLVGFAPTRTLDEIIQAVAAEQSSTRQAAA